MNINDKRPELNELELLYHLVMRWCNKQLCLDAYFVTSAPYFIIRGKCNYFQMIYKRKLDNLGIWNSFNDATNVFLVKYVSAKKN